MNAALRAYNQDSTIMYLGGSKTHTQVGVHSIPRGPLKKGISSTLTVLQSRIIQSGTDPVTPISLNAISLREILGLKPDVVHIHNFYKIFLSLNLSMTFLLFL
jgi:ABC-type Fe3+-hydroxamate transport system substrate-binding protein